MVFKLIPPCYFQRMSLNNIYLFNFYLNIKLQWWDFGFHIFNINAVFSSNYPTTSYCPPVLLVFSQHRTRICVPNLILAFLPIVPPRLHRSFSSLEKVSSALRKGKAASCVLAFTPFWLHSVIFRDKSFFSGHLHSGNYIKNYKWKFNISGILF